MRLLYKLIERHSNIYPHYKLIARCKTYYITTPIFYVNSSPHIGHLYTAALADTQARWQQLKTGQYTMLATGTDEHGLKILKSAQANGLDTMLFCDQVSQKFKEMCTTFDIRHNDFIRTTEERHVCAVEHFWKTLKDRGYIYKGSYEGWYSLPDETFLGSNQVEEVGERGQTFHVSRESGHRVEWTSESNYLFRMSALADELKSFLEENPGFVRPERHYNALMRHFEKPIGDISISRERKRVPWGIPVPGDDSQTVYVWFDALINYLTVAGYPDVESSSFERLWPASVHVVGMDILKFHALFWPAFLLAAGLELPRQIICHAHWTCDGQKMSKSIGNVVDPSQMAAQVTAEGLKYYLLKYSDLSSDCDYSELKLYHTVNTDFSNVIGNCLHRSTAKFLNPSSTYLTFHSEYFAENELKTTSELINVKDLYKYMRDIQELPDLIDELAQDFKFSEVLQKIIETIRKTNMLVQKNELWTLDKHDDHQLKVQESVLYCVYEGLKVCGILLQPLAPNLAAKLLDKLSISEDSRTWEQTKNSFLEVSGGNSIHVGKKLKISRDVLFKRLKIPLRLLQTNSKDKESVKNSH